MTIALAPGRPRWPRNEGAVTPLKPPQIRWLGALLLATQVPQALQLPMWVALFGVMLVALRFALLRANRTRPATRPARIPAWALALFAVVLGIAIRQSYGMFLARDPCVAFLYLLVGIKFLEARTLRDGTLLVCLAMALMLTPFFYNQSMAAAAAVVPAILIMGGTLDALARPTAEDFEFQAWRRAVQRTAVMLVQGAPVALLLFVMFPRLAGPLWGLPHDAGARTGLSETMSPGSISGLSLSDAVAFRVDFTGALPAPPLRYWRGPVLSRFDGHEWRANRPRPGGVMPSTQGVPSFTYAVSLEPSGRPWLFALDMPATLPIAAGDNGEAAAGPPLARLTREQQLVANIAVSQPVRYVVTSVPTGDYPATSMVDVEQSRALPPGNPRTLAFARQLRGRFPDERQYIGAVLDWFREQAFVYTLAPPYYDGEPVDNFLFGARRGFCEHYASAFVVLLRDAGIPARVVTGYQGGEVNRNGGYLMVRQSDAHAWAEAYVGGEWRRFDPTAAVSPLRIEGGIGAALPDSDAVPLLARIDGGWLKRIRLALDAMDYHWKRNVVEFDFQRQRAMWESLSLTRFAPWQVAAGVALLLGAWAAATLGWLAQRRRRDERALVLWSKVCRRLARAGLARLPHEGPLAYAARAAARWPQFAIAFHAIGESFAMLRYGAAAPGDRAAMLATLERAIDVLPPARDLRSADASGPARRGVLA
jgi:transglutaminase-like putative cysteine protease